MAFIKVYLIFLLLLNSQKMKCLNFLSPLHFSYFLILAWAQQVSPQTQTRTQTQNNNTDINFVTSYQVGVILDMGSSLGRMVNGCISMGISDFYAEHNHYKTRLVLHSTDSMGEPLRALSLAVDHLQKNQVQAIIGPQTSNEAEFLVDLGVRAQVPIISFSVTSPFLTQVKTPYFVRVATNDNFQVKVIAALVQEFRWREVVFIYEDSIYGNGIIPQLISALDEIHAHISYSSVIFPSATDNDIVIELYKLMTMSTRVFLVHMSSFLASRVFSKVKEVGMMSKGYAWIVTDGITNMLPSMDSLVTGSMEGVLGIRSYLPPSKKLKIFMTKWRSQFSKGNQRIFKIDDLNRYCLWAYDAVWVLSRATEKVGIITSRHKLNSSTKLTNIMSISVSETGLELLKEILQSKFVGISGNFQLINGELQPTAFQIVNVVRSGIRVIGFWTPKNGVSKDLNLSSKKASSYSMTSLKVHIWPGASITTPRGWIMPLNGKKLRVGVPIRIVSKELVNVERDPHTNATSASGFCIDVFKAAVKTLPYALPYEFIPFGNFDERMMRNYDDLLYQVYLQKYDAAVGDIVITPNRFSVVDFTLPFTEDGFAFVVPKVKKNRSMWIFLEPLTIDLWLAIAGFFILTGLVVWIIEHRSSPRHWNNNLSLQQIGMVFWYSISNLVFAPGEKLMSRLSKFVMIIWLSVALIMTSSYTASLSSMLTARQFLEFPNIGSYSGNVTDLTGFGPIGEYANGTRPGSKKGAVTAFVGQMPYVKLFLAEHHADFTLQNTTHNGSNGFGFAFPKGSPLVADFSRAIAKLREDGELASIEKLWFGDQYHQLTITNEESLAETNVLNFYCFRGLFFIMGITIASAFIISCVFMKDKPTSKEETSLVNSVGEEEPLPAGNLSLASIISNHSIDRIIITEEDSEWFDKHMSIKDQTHEINALQQTSRKQAQDLI